MRKTQEKAILGLYITNTFLSVCSNVCTHMPFPDQNKKNILKVVVGSERAESWSQLSIQYAVPWPLHLIITPSAISRYNKVRLEAYLEKS